MKRGKNALYHSANHGHETLQHMGWLLAQNKTETPVVTSDLPVVHYFHQDFEDVDKVNWELQGRQIFCPLAPDRILILLDPV